MLNVLELTAIGNCCNLAKRPPNVVQNDGYRENDGYRVPAGYRVQHIYIYNLVCTIDTVLGNLAVDSVFINFRSMRETKKFHFFSFLYNITVSFTMVIKRSPGGESAGDGRSTSKSTCADPAWSLTAWFGDRPAYGMSKLSASVNSDLGNGSFWLEIPHAEHVDRCCWNMREWLARVWSYQRTSDLRDVYFFGYACNARVWSSLGAYVCFRRPAGLHRYERSCSDIGLCGLCLVTPIQHTFPSDDAERGNVT